MQRGTWIPHHDEHLRNSRRTTVPLSLQYRRGLMRGPNLPVLAGNETFTRFSILEKLASILSYESDKRVGFSHYWPVSQMSFSNIKLFCFHHPCLSLEMWPEQRLPENLVLGSTFLIKFAVWKTKIGVRDFLQPPNCFVLQQKRCRAFSPKGGPRPLGVLHVNNGWII